MRCCLRGGRRPLTGRTSFVWPVDDSDLLNEVEEEAETFEPLVTVLASGGGGGGGGGHESINIAWDTPETSARPDGYYDGVPDGYYVRETPDGEFLEPVEPVCAMCFHPKNSHRIDGPDGANYSIGCGETLCFCGGFEHFQSSAAGDRRCDGDYIYGVYGDEYYRCNKPAGHPGIHGYDCSFDIVEAFKSSARPAPPRVDSADPSPTAAPTQQVAVGDGQTPDGRPTSELLNEAVLTLVLFSDWLVGTTRKTYWRTDIEPLLAELCDRATELAEIEGD